jgi:hypothetical protein
MQAEAKKQLGKLKRARRKAELLCDEVILAHKIAKGEVELTVPGDDKDLATFKMLWRNYALVDDAKLTEGGRRLKQELLGTVDTAGPPEQVYLQPRERDTIIAALRYWQRCGDFAGEDIQTIADNQREGDAAQLSKDEIDALIEQRLNA